MRCPVCQSNSLRVIDSRDTADAVRRRRQCEDCSHRFTTYERLEAMRCPRCSSPDTRVMQASELAQSVRRQRECAECGNRFLTSERVDPRGFVVVKRDGRREEFNHGKLLEKIRIACTKRPVPPTAISKLTAEVERWTSALLGAAPLALRATKQMMLRGLARGSVEAAFVATYPAYEAMLASEDAREGMQAFIDKRSPVWRGR